MTKQLSESRKKQLYSQTGKSLEFDFEKNTWTFQMPEGFVSSAGEFLIMPLLKEHD